MAHLITGYAGHEHIQSADEGAFNAAFLGQGQFVMETGNQYEASITSNNGIRILDGDLLMYGRHVRIEPNTYEDLVIETGTAGTNRTDLIVMTYEKNTNDGTETAYLQVIKGTETTGTATIPEYTDGNILNGATFNQMPLYKVNIAGVVLESVEAMFEIAPTFKTLAEQYEEQFKQHCETHLDSLNILDTMEEVEANTQPNQMAGALAVKEVCEELATRSMNFASLQQVPGVTQASTLEEIIAAMPNHSIVTTWINQSTYYPNLYNEIKEKIAAISGNINIFGNLTIEKSDVATTIILRVRSMPEHTYMCSYSTTSTGWGEWRKVITDAAFKTWEIEDAPDIKADHWFEYEYPHGLSNIIPLGFTCTEMEEMGTNTGCINKCNMDCVKVNDSAVKVRIQNASTEEVGIYFRVKFAYIQL